MALSTTQLQTLKTDITVTRAAAPYQGSTLGTLYAGGGDGVTASFYNQIAVPSVILWMPKVSIDLLVQAVVMSEFLALTVAKQNGWFMLTQPSFADSTLTRTRQNFIDIFGVASVTVANLIANSQRLATYYEALFAVSGGLPGTGFVSPVFGIPLSTNDVSESHAV